MQIITALFNLISYFVALLVRTFPFSFPLLIALFWFLSLPIHAIPADLLPADKKPPKSCVLYHPAGYTDILVCDVLGAAKLSPTKPSNWERCDMYGPGKGLPGTSFKDQFGNVYSFSDATYSVTKSNSTTWHVRSTVAESRGGNFVQNCTSQIIAVIDPGMLSYSCPPDDHPEYDTLVESDEGQKYCLKSGPDNNAWLDKAEQPAGKAVYLAHSATGVTSPICKEGCAVNPSGVTVCLPWDSPNFPSGSLVRCLGEAVFSGQPCPAPVSPDDPAPQDGETTDGEKAPPTNTDEECVLAFNPATGKKECQSVSTSNNPSSKSCGYINGVWSCVDNGDGGSKTTTTNKEQTQQTDPETGNTTTTDKTTATVTSCKGSDCKTTTATTTTSTVTNSSGGVVGSVSSCTGDGCGADAPGGDGELPDQPVLPDVSELADAIDQFDLQARADIEAEISKQYGDNGETVLTSSALPFSDLLPSQTSCTNPVFSPSYGSVTTAYGAVTFDVCSIANLVNLILSFICGVLTAIHVLGVLYETAKQTGA